MFKENGISDFHFEDVISTPCINSFGFACGEFLAQHL